MLSKLWQIFCKSTSPGEMADAGACGSHGRMLGVVGVFEVGKENSFEFV